MSTLNTINLEFIEAASIIDASGVATMVADWMAAEGTELADDTLRDLSHVLSGWLATGLAGFPLTDENVSQALQENGMAHATPARVHGFTSLLLDLMDYSPLPTGAPLTKAAYEAALKARAESSEKLKAKRLRHLAFTNSILRAQLDSTACVDGTLSIALGSLFRTAGVAGVSLRAYEQMPAAEHVSAEPDAGFRLNDPDTGELDDGWGYEVATLQSTDLLRSDSVPNIIIGVAGHKPRDYGAAAGELVQDILGSGRTIERVSGDLAYFPTLHPELVQAPLREHGAQLVMRYTPQDEGRVLAASGDSILVEGRWYRSDLPTPLLEAMADFRAAQQRNRKPDGRCVLDARVESTLKDRRDAVLAARRPYEVPAPIPSKYEQTHPYGSTEWQMSITDGLYENTSFRASFRDANAALTPHTSQYTGEAAHGFMTTLIIASMNARRIADWKLYHALDEGNGVLVDEWYAMYHLIVPRLQDRMASWSAEKQPASLEVGGGHWAVSGEDTDDWVPDGGAAVVEMTRATDDVAERIVEKLLHELRLQGTSLLEEGGDERDLSRHSFISLHLDFVDANQYDGDEDDVWAPVPAEGVLIAAQATIRPRWNWRHP